MERFFNQNSWNIKNFFLQPLLKEMAPTQADALSMFYHYFTYFYFYSFVGFIWETTITSIDHGSFQHRGFLHLPIIPIYGFTILFILIAFYQRNFTFTQVLLGSAIITCIQEYLTSWGMEKLFHQVWWDYSHMRFHLNGRISLLSTVTFSIGSVLIVYFFHPHVSRKMKRLHQRKEGRNLCFILFVLVLIDTVVSTLQMFH